MIRRFLSLFEPFILALLGTVLLATILPAPGGWAELASAAATVGMWSPITPLRGVGTVQDVAAAVVWLAGPGSAFVSRQTLMVDGGVFSQKVWPAY